MHLRLLPLAAVLGAAVGCTLGTPEHPDAVDPGATFEATLPITYDEAAYNEEIAHACAGLPSGWVADGATYSGMTPTESVSGIGQVVPPADRGDPNTSIAPADWFCFDTETGIGVDEGASGSTVFTITVPSDFPASADLTLHWMIGVSYDPSEYDATTSAIDVNEPADTDPPDTDTDPDEGGEGGDDSGEPEPGGCDCDANAAGVGGAAVLMLPLVLFARRRDT